MQIIPANYKNRIKKMQRGQILVMAALFMVVILAVIGLALDIGVIFINYGRLRRAVDAAALAAALQYTQGSTISSMKGEAEQFLLLNGVSDPTVDIVICNTNESDPMNQPDNRLPDGSSICQQDLTGQYKKLVFVQASSTVELSFMKVLAPIINFSTINIVAQATSEAASVDVMLVLDTSESMTYDKPPDSHPDTVTYPTNYPGPPYDPNSEGRDPSYCNHNANTVYNGDTYTGTCSPFQLVKQNAVFFVKQLYFPYDRVGIITFNQDITYNLPFTSTQADIISAIEQLTVGEGQGGVKYDGTDTTCEDPTHHLGADKLNLCREYVNAPGGTYTYDGTNPIYIGFYCQSWSSTGDPSQCGTTNTGGALLRAATEFSDDQRTDSLWVTILLTDGGADSGFSDEPGYVGTPFCPTYWWTQAPICRNPNTPPTRISPTDIPHYDVMDYAMDMADALASNNVLIYTIGMGQVIANQNDPGNYNKAGAVAARSFLQYAVGGKGVSYIAPYGEDTQVDQELHNIFLAIANNIATRLAK